jgi:hypothetical protein
MDIETITKIHVERGDLLYIQLPKDAPHEAMLGLWITLREKIPQERGVIILVGTNELDFKVIDKEMLRSMLGSKEPS